MERSTRKQRFFRGSGTILPPVAAAVHMVGDAIGDAKLHGLSMVSEYRWFLALFIAGVLVHLTALAPCFAQSEAPESHWVNSRYHLNLTISPEFERVTTELPSVLLALRHRDSGEPTVNIIVEPGNLEVEEKWLSSRAEEVLGSYRRLGLTDAQLRSKEVTPFGGVIAFTFRLTYTLDQKPREASVVLCPGDGVHFIITAIDKVPSAAPGSIATLLASFQAPLTTPPESESNNFFYLLLILMLLGIGAGIWGFRRSRRA